MSEERIKELIAICNARWQALSSDLFHKVPDFIRSQFEQFLQNPLIVALTSVLLAVAGFYILRKIVIAVQSHGV